MTTFFLYQKSTGIIFLALPGMPDNDDFVNTGDICFQGNYYAKGLKWENVDYEIIDPVDIDAVPEKYIYIPSSGEIQNNPDYHEVQE